MANDKELIERIVLEVANDLQDFPGSRPERLAELATRFLARVDAERAKEQKPVAWIVRSRGGFNTQADAMQSWRYSGQRNDEKPEPLYTSPQPIPEWYKLVPAALPEGVEDYLQERLFSNHVKAQLVWGNMLKMLAAAPEVKP
jgi:hypothetical protein